MIVKTDCGHRISLIPGETPDLARVLASDPAELRATGPLHCPECGAYLFLTRTSDERLVIAEYPRSYFARCDCPLEPPQPDD
jgi:hypothetical protein